MSRFLNRVILADAATRRRKNLIVYVLDEKNWCPSEDVDCGITASKLLKQSSERIFDRIIPVRLHQIISVYNCENNGDKSS